MHDERRARKVCINQPTNGPKHGKVFRAGRCKVCYRAVRAQVNARYREKRIEARKLKELVGGNATPANTNGAIAPQLTLDLPPREQTQLDCDTPPALSEPVERTGDP